MGSPFAGPDTSHPAPHPVPMVKAPKIMDCNIQLLSQYVKDASTNLLACGLADPVVISPYELPYCCHDFILGRFDECLQARTEWHWNIRRCHPLDGTL